MDRWRRRQHRRSRNREDLEVRASAVQWYIRADVVPGRFRRRHIKQPWVLHKDEFVVFVLDIVICTNITDYYFFLLDCVSYIRYYYRNPD